MNNNVNFSIENLPNFFNSFDIASKFTIHISRSDLSLLTSLEVISSVKEPIWNSTSLWISNDISDFLNLFFGQFTSSEVKRDSGLVAKKDSKSSSDTSNLSDSKWSLSSSIEISVENSQNVFECFWVFVNKCVSLLCKIWMLTIFFLIKRFYIKVIQFINNLFSLKLIFFGDRKLEKNGRLGRKRN